MVDKPVIRSRMTTAESQLKELRGLSKISRSQFERNRTIQAAILHHAQIAIQACCDIASHIVADEGWGIPGTTGELFDPLASHRVITRSSAKKLRKQVGFRNLIVHGYDKIDLARVHTSLPERRTVVTHFLKAVAKYARV